MRYFIKLRFKGTRYHGWQIQDNANAVQQTVNHALSLVLREKIETLGCGRTDTGVHASFFIAHFDVKREIADCPAVLGKLASLKIPDIDFMEFIPVKENANARFDAVSRTYEYHIIRTRNPFLMDFAYYLYGPLEVKKMEIVTTELIGLKDFGAFSKSRTQVKTNLCEITNAKWEWRDEKLVFTITADRFLRNMVRAIVGTLIEIGQGKRDASDFIKVIESRRRSRAGMSVPACGLFLTNVKYPADIFI